MYGKRVEKHEEGNLHALRDSKSVKRGDHIKGLEDHAFMWFLTHTVGVCYIQQD